MTPARKAQVKKLSTQNFKIMIAGKKKRAGGQAFSISHDAINEAVNDFLKNGGEIKTCYITDEVSGPNLPGESDNFLLGI